MNADTQSSDKILITLLHCCNI